MNLFFFNQIKATGCSSTIAGRIATTNGENCTANGRGLPDANCIFYPDVNTTHESSIMNLHPYNQVFFYIGNHFSNKILKIKNKFL